MKSFLLYGIVLLMCLCAAEFEDKFDDILKNMKAYFDIRISQLKDTIGDFLPLRILCFPWTPSLV